MAGKRKRIHCDFSSKASIANPQIRVVVIVTSNSRVDAVITSGNTQGSANGMPFYKSLKLNKRKKNDQRSVKRILIKLKGNDIGGKKIPITLTKLKGKPTSSNSSFLVNDIGFVVRTYAPLNVKQWRNVEKKEVDKMIERIMSKYDIDMSLPHVSTYIKNALQRLFVDFRHKLKKHFDSYPTLEEAQQNKHEDVTSQEEWKFLCDRYASVQFKNVQIRMP
ncbi:hypothetical protein COP2_039658 [Malus domestica]